MSTEPTPLLAMIDEPDRYSATREMWEQYLRELRQLPDETINKQGMIEHAEYVLKNKMYASS